MNTALPSVLLVDDDPAVGTVLSALLRQAGISSREVGSGEVALAALEKAPADLVVTDLRMPGIDGMKLLAEIVRRWPDQQVIVLTAHGSVPLAVEAMRLGATDFLLKPFDADEVVYVIRKALAKSAHLDDAVPAVEPRRTDFAASDGMREVDALIDRVAPLALCDLTTNETLFTIKAQDWDDRLGVAHMDEISSPEGIPILRDHKYELVTVYNNTTPADIDAMSILYLYCRDWSFESKSSAAADSR
jgi:FixJ family two-component response regulator